MRRLLLAAVLAAAVATVPASADPLVQTCDSDDYTVARVEAAGVEVAHVCTSEHPYEYLPAIYCGYELRPVCALLGPIGS